MARDLNVTPAELEKTITYEDFTENTAVIRFSPGDTKDMPPGIYFYVCRIFKADGTVDTFIEKSIFELEVS